jgi:hypothetical protein
MTRRVALVTVMVLAAVNMWTGAPLLGVWIGSRVQGTGGASMAAFAVVAVTILVVALACVRVLAICEARYDALVGRAPGPRRQAPWLRSLRGERDPRRGGEGPALTALERVLVASVVSAVLVFEVWFFFFAGSSIGSA